MENEEIEVIDEEPEPEDEESYRQWQRKQRVEKDLEKRQERSQYYD
ncbi:hypothetical protein ACE38W_00645 [Chitinophaga sp. Hz27]